MVLLATPPLVFIIYASYIMFQLPHDYISPRKLTMIKEKQIQMLGKLQGSYHYQYISLLCLKIGEK